MTTETIALAVRTPKFTSAVVIRTAEDGHRYAFMHRPTTLWLRIYLRARGWMPWYDDPKRTWCLPGPSKNRSLLELLELPPPEHVI